MRIVRVGDPNDAVLSRRAEPVEAVDRHVRSLMQALLDTMRSQKNARGEQVALGLAAPQVGVPKRVIAIGGEAAAPFALANPEIVWRSEKQAAGIEKCLSIPGKVALVVRADEVEVVGLDRRGKEFRVCGAGLLAAVLQHEIDHLDGILITDRQVAPRPKEAAAGVQA